METVSNKPYVYIIDFFLALVDGIKFVLKNRQQEGLARYILLQGLTQRRSSMTI